MTRLEQLQSFLAESPNDAFLHYAIAQEYKSMGNKELALEKYLYLIDNHPNYVATYYHLGKLYIELGQKETALSCFENGIIKEKECGEQHSLSELQSAKLELEYDED